MALVSPLPAGWRWARLGDVIAEAKPGFASGERDANGVVQLRMNNVDTRGNMVWEEFIRVPAEKPLISDFQLMWGDVLFNNTNSVELVGKNALFLGSLEPVVYSNHFTRLRVDAQRLDSRYLAAWLLQQWQLKVFENLCNRWIGQSAVKNDKLLALEIPLPPLEEQKRIAAILNEQLGAVERARAAAEAQLEAAKALPSAYLRAVFSSPEAQQWPVFPIGSLGEPDRGETVQTGPFGAQLPSAEFTGAGVPVLNIGNVQWGYLDLSRLDHVTIQKAADLERYTVREGDLLFTRSGTIGRCCIVPASCNGWLISYHLLRVAFDFGSMYPEFAGAAMRGSESVLAQLRLISGRGATRDGVNSTILSNLRIPVPPLAEQQRIAAILNEQMVSAERARRAIKEELYGINKLPAALLRLAFSGEL